jgi:hypothetical protein
LLILYPITWIININRGILAWGYNSIGTHRISMILLVISDATKHPI